MATSHLDYFFVSLSWNARRLMEDHSRTQYLELNWHVSSYPIFHMSIYWWCSMSSCFFNSDRIAICVCMDTFSFLFFKKEQRRHGCWQQNTSRCMTFSPHLFPSNSPFFDTYNFLFNTKENWIKLHTLCENVKIILRWCIIKIMGYLC